MARKSSVVPMLGAIMGGIKAERAPSEKQMVKDHAKHAMRRATQDWVDGRISTKEHSAVHARGKHVMEGKKVREFKGKSGERKIKGLI